MNTDQVESKKEWREFQKMIVQSDKDNEKVLIFHFYSGHGVLTEGMQALLLN